MSLLLFVTEAQWLALHSQSIRRAFAEHSQSIRRAFAEILRQRIFFFEEPKTRNLVKIHLEMHANIDDFKTRNLVKIIWKCIRILMILRPQKIEVVVVGSGHASRDNRGPIITFLKRSPKSSRFLEIS